MVLGTRVVEYWLLAPSGLPIQSPYFEVSGPLKALPGGLAVGLEALARRLVLMWPRGSKYPIFKASGPKNHTLNGFWDQSP